MPAFIYPNSSFCLVKPDHSYSGSEGNEKLILFFLAVTTCAWKYETVIQNKYHKVPKYLNYLLKGDKLSCNVKGREGLLSQKEHCDFLQHHCFCLSK